MTKTLQEASGEPGQRLSLVAAGKRPALWIYGLGTAADFGPGEAERWLARVVRDARREGCRSIALVLPDHPVFAGVTGLEGAARRLALSGYDYSEFRDREPRPADPVLTLCGGGVPGAAAAVQRGSQVAAAIARARDLANTPPNLATPDWMAGQARELAAERGWRCRILRPAELRRLRMEGILAVGSGSRNPPRLVRIEIGDRGPRVALVGKGVTFDSGGLSIKPAARMEEMKWDKCGACTVLGIALAADALQLPVRLSLFLPLAENLPDGQAYRPSDILRLRNGKTVEIINTDAEGRLILADALAWACEDDPDWLLEYSTLTGAAVVALGQQTGALFASDEEIADGLLDSAARCGERLWRLPLDSSYREALRSTHADLRNTGGRWGGAATAAAFLAAFVPAGQRWAHWDIAGPAYTTQSGAGYGATGFGIATTIDWLRHL